MQMRTGIVLQLMQSRSVSGLISYSINCCCDTLRPFECVKYSDNNMCLSGLDNGNNSSGSICLVFPGDQTTVG